jgi:hypothetical protein
MISHDQVSQAAEFQPAKDVGNIPAYVGSVLTPSSESDLWAIQRKPFEAQASSLSPEDIQAGLVMPQILEAKMLHPGQRTGLTQTVLTKAEYPPLPDGSPIRRLGEVVDQIKYKGHWRNMTSHPEIIFSRNEGGIGGFAQTPTGHEGNFVYWRPGERVRAEFINVVKDPQTGDIEGRKMKFVRVQIGGK